VFKKFPEADVSAFIIWIPILEKDTLEAAIPSVKFLDDKRIRHFYDSNKAVGKVIAESVGWIDNIAWDIYAFYLPPAKWIDEAPLPIYWMHQLKDEWATKDTYRTGNDLSVELEASMKQLF